MKPTGAWRAAMASSCALALIAPFALAQEAPSQDDALKPTLVAVTANKREENIKDVPVSLTSLDEAALDAIDPVTGGALIDDNAFPRAPEWIGNFAFGYTRDWRGGEIFASTDWSYRSDPNIFLYESTEFTAEGGAAPGYRKGPWSAKAFVRNLTDEIGTVSAIDFNKLTGIFNQPRIYGIELGWTM